MPWPQLTDYQEAVQHPDLCFSDSELRQGQPLLDPLGLPRPVTGGFASVYQFSCDGRRYAVRCFNRYQPDIEGRYARIGEALRAARLPYTVLFDFVPRGIKVRGDWYPIVKMEWVDGDPLHLYVERHLARPAAIRLLAHKFARLCADLERGAIAHGDLQHGNILVVGGELKLIDYDGMYVPAFAGLPSPEVGHRNYQHPRRGERDFGPRLDRFSAWVIFASLVALSVEPALWGRLDAGDECLLFRQADFERPEASAVLRALASLPDETARALASAVHAAIGTPDLAALPALDRLAAPAAVRPATLAVPLPEWARDYVDLGPAAAPPAPATPAANGANGAAVATAPPTWVLDHLQAGAPVAFSGSLLVERVVGMIGLLTLFAVVAGAWFGLPTPIVAASSATGAATAALAALGWRYAHRAEVVRKRFLRAERRRLRRAIRQDERLLARGKAALAKLERQEAKALAGLDPKRQDSLRRERNDLASIDQRLKPAMARIDQARQALGQAEVTDIERALARLHDRLLNRQLAGHWLISASIEGVGAAIKARLLAAGVRTAADIAQVRCQLGSSTVEIEVAGHGPVRVPGVGPARATALAAWRRRLEAGYRAGLPTTLPAADEAVIRTRYLSRRQELDRRAQEAAQDARQRADNVRRAYGDEQARLGQQIRAIRDRRAERAAGVEQQLTEARASLADGHWRLAAVQHELAAYERVTVGAFLRRLLFMP